MNGVLPEPASARWFCWLFTPQADRGRVAALFAIESGVLQSARAGLDHSVAHARIDWWQSELERLAAGLPSHPQAKLLLQLSRAASLPAPNLLGLVEAVRFDLAQIVPADRSELAGRCEHWADAIFRTLAMRARATDATFASTAGAALAELELLASIHSEARAGRLRMPLDAVEATGCRPESLASPPYAEALAAAIRERHRVLRDTLAHASSSLDPDARRSLRGALAWIAVAERGSLASERALPGVREPGRLDGPLATWAAWRAARRAERARV